MPTPSPRLGIPLPLGNETVSRQAFLDVYNAIDANAATRAEPEVLAQDLFAQGFVASGLAATKDSGAGNKVNVTAGVAYVSQLGGGLRRYSLPAAGFTATSASALYYLDLQPDGTWSWATTHSAQTGYLPVAEVQTDASGSITAVTDRRPLAPGLSPVNADRLDGYHAGHSSGQVPVSDGALNAGLNADQLDGYHAGHAAGQVPVSDGQANTNLNADLLDGQHGDFYRNAANLNAGTVPLDRIPTPLTGKDADTVDGAHAGTGAGNVLRLDGSGLVPLANIPTVLAGKDADTLDGQHGSYYASAASVGAVARLFADANAKDFVLSGTGVGVQSDSGAWSGQAVVADASVAGSAAADIVIFPISTLRWTEYVVAVRMQTNDATTANLAVLYLEQYVNSAWQTVAQKQVDGAMFTQAGDYEVFYVRGHYSAGSQFRVRVRWNRATATHVLSVDAIVIVPVGATAAV